MASKEALDKIKYIDIDGRYPYPNFLKDDVKYKESIEVIEKRLNELEERDTPVKIYYHTIKAFRKDDCDSVVALCPVCSMDVFNIFETFNYCPRCGQRLDWEEE